MGDLLGLERTRDDAVYLAAFRQGRVREGAHEADMAAAVDEPDPPVSQVPSQRLGGWRSEDPRPGLTRSKPRWTTVLRTSPSPAKSREGTVGTRAAGSSPTSRLTMTAPGRRTRSEVRRADLSVRAPWGIVDVHIRGRVGQDRVLEPEMGRARVATPSTSFA